MNRLAITLLMCLAVECSGQSIMVSGGRSSVVASGSGAAIVDDTERKQLRYENQFLRDSLNAATAKPVAETTSEKPRARYLVSEPWCQYCPSAKRKFLANGHPPENILTVAECKARFGFTVPHLPYEFLEPVTVAQAKQTKPAASKLMSHSEQVALHNRLHGGGSWTWPGDLSTHLRTVHGVNTSAPIQSAPRVQQSGNCPSGNCPTNRSVRRRRGLFGLFR